MGLDSFTQALGGPLMAKLALAAVSLAALLFLRRTETEGLLGGYVALAVLLILRDLAFAFVPHPDLFRISDLLVFGLLFVASTGGDGPRRLGAAFFWVPVGLSAFAALLLSFKALFALAPALPSEALRLLALVPIGAAFLAAGPLGKLAPDSLPGRIRFVLLPASILYLAVGALLGPESLLFQSLVVPLSYASLLALAFMHEELSKRQLVDAAAYYEEAVDDLYGLLGATGEVLKSGFHLQEVLDALARSVAERTGAEGALVLLAEEDEEGSFVVRSLHGRFAPPFKLPESLPRSEERVSSHLRHARVRAGEGLLGEAAAEGNPLFLPRAGEDPRVVRNGEEDWLRLSSFMAAPLTLKDRVVGLLALARSGGEGFSERDFDRFKLLVSFGSIAVANSFAFLEAAERSDIEREAAIAADIQKTIVPRKLPDLGRLAFSAYTEAAKGVCSDYYDVIRTAPDRCIVAMGDVAGKGVQASLVMVMIRSILHLVTNSTKDLATLLSWLNRGIAGKIDMDHFATLCLLSIDAATGELEFANAAHQPLLVYRRDADAIETVDIKSIPVGVERATEYNAKKLKLRQGDILLLYTDGIVEAMNEGGKQYGRKNLGQALARARDLPPAKIAETIREEVRDFTGRARRHDDQSLLVVKAKA